MEAEMAWQAFQDLMYRACHCDENTADPIAYWQQFKQEQQRYIQLLEGHDLVVLRGPNVDLSLKISGRRFINSCGIHNLPDGEIYTGPVENSAHGWVRFNYPAIYSGRMAEGIELFFDNGKVVKATAQKNQAMLLEMLDTDWGARYIGEFAIGTNF